METSRPGVGAPQGRSGDGSEGSSSSRRGRSRATSRVTAAALASAAAWLLWPAAAIAAPAATRRVTLYRPCFMSMAPFTFSATSSLCSSFHSGRSVALAAAPRKRLPERSVEVRCSGCKGILYKYAKANGKGSALVKCYHERILEDFTVPPGSLFCPSCKAEFARPAMIHGRPANKIIGGKVFMK